MNDQAKKLIELTRDHPNAAQILELFEDVARERDNLRNAVTDALDRARALAYDLSNA